MSDPTDAITQNTKFMLTAAREELARADTKASILLAASSIAIGPSLSASLTGSWGPARIWNGIEWLWWIGALSAVSAIGMLAYAVYPRVKRRGIIAPRVTFFGDANLESKDDLRSALARSSEGQQELLVDQLWQVSLIVSKKYRSIQISLWLFALSLILNGIVLLVEAT